MLKYLLFALGAQTQGRAQPQRHFSTNILISWGISPHPKHLDQPQIHRDSLAYNLELLKNISLLL